MISRRAPCPGVDSIESSPPMARTRSLMTKGPRLEFLSCPDETLPLNSQFAARPRRQHYIGDITHEFRANTSIVTILIDHPA